MTHDWDPATGYCTRCGVLNVCPAGECLATPNCHGIMHILARRKKITVGALFEEIAERIRKLEEGKIPPPESA